jgi:predicted nucleic acid-binding protein
MRCPAGEFRRSARNAATAVHHGLVVLHDDADFVTVARFLPDVSERNVHNAPGL